MFQPRILLASLMVVLITAPSLMALEIKAAVLRVDKVLPLPTTRLDIRPADLGFAGGALATDDNQTTGQFTGTSFTLETVAVAPDGVSDALEDLLASDIRLIVVMADGDTLQALADQAGARALLFNATAQDTVLRKEGCRANVLHIAPSRAMLTDAVMQFLLWKKWPELMLISGSHPEDKLLADSYLVSATKFGAEVVEERVFEDTGGARRTDTGHVLVQRQIPVFTQDTPRHDVVVAADEADVFAAYLPFHLWTPRPVVGSAGLRPTTWHPAHEAWGATQFQRRFERLAGRYMREEDYQVWLALRVVGEAVTRTTSDDISMLKDYALSDDFELAAFKGQKLTFRDWNGQMRQPILLTDSRITVSVSPQEGYLHQRSPLDSLGVDAPESTCIAFEEG